MSEALNALLDAQLDDLADAPEFGVFPPGTHRVILEIESKEVNDKPCFEIKLTAVETEELANPEQDSPVKQGDQSSVLFFMDKDLGQGQFKKAAKMIAEITGTTSIRDTVEAAKGLEVSATVKTRQNKEKTATYQQLVKIQA